MTHRQSNNDIQSNQSSWYAKLHPIGTDQQTTEPKRLLNLSIFFRIWLAVALILILCGTVVFTQLYSHVRPTAQQVIEDTLLDTSKMLAASLQIPLQSGQLLTDAYQTQLDSAFINIVNTPATPEAIKPDKNIARKTSNYDKQDDNQPAYRQKTASSFRVYITDSSGLVIYDSRPAPTNAEGQDYSRWNDVYLTLKGEYGARSTPDNNSTLDSSIMYVAQPINDASGDLIGVVSVGKPVASVLPYLDNTRRRMLFTMLIISIAALILAGLVAWWLKQSISLVTHYTSALAEDTKKPYFYLGHELNSLTDTIESMKHRLENRAYVSDYVHTLTHELKSPLTAIRASSELLEDDGLDGDDRLILNQTIGEQSIKMQQLIDRLLLLAKVEQPTFRLNRQLTPLLLLINSLVKDNAAKIQQRHLAAIKLYVNDELLDSTSKESHQQADLLAMTTIYADSFWLVQALQNIMDNAIYFAKRSVTVKVSSPAHNLVGSPVNNPTDSATPSVTIDIFNDGKLLPDYAINKAFERYFSLSHQSQMFESQADSSTTLPKKGIGLGLTLVKQVIEHHGGTVIINNVHANSTNNQYSGVIVSITLPLADNKDTKS